MSERRFREPRRRGFEDQVFMPRRPRGFASPVARREPVLGPRLRASVKWFNPEKGFGFVVLEDGSGEAFLHAGVVERSGYDPRDLPAGASLLVSVEAGQKGPQVGEVFEVDKTAATAVPANSGRRQTADATAAQTGRMTGTVKWYSPEKRFGFVAVEDGQREVFVHASALQRSGLVSLAEGQRVAIEVAQGRKGLEAVSVSITG